METPISMIKDYANNSGVLDLVQMFYKDELPKIEFDDLKRLEKIVSDNPLLAHQIVKALISYNVPAFYKLIREILQERKSKPKGHYLGSDGQNIIN